jgi:hypothetical protein
MRRVAHKQRARTESEPSLVDEDIIAIVKQLVK